MQSIAIRSMKTAQLYYNTETRAYYVRADVLGCRGGGMLVGFSSSDPNAAIAEAESYGYTVRRF